MNHSSGLKRQNCGNLQALTASSATVPSLVSLGRMGAGAIGGFGGGGGGEGSIAQVLEVKSGLRYNLFALLLNVGVTTFGSLFEGDLLETRISYENFYFN